MTSEGRVTVRLPEQLLARLEEQAATQRRSLSEVIRLTLDDHLPKVPEVERVDVA